MEDQPNFNFQLSSWTTHQSLSLDIKTKEHNQDPATDPARESQMVISIHCFSRSLLLLICLFATSTCFSSQEFSTRQPTCQFQASSDVSTSTRAPPRTGFAQTLLNYALNSPLWKQVLVPQARQNIVKTAEVCMPTSCTRMLRIRLAQPSVSLTHPPFTLLTEQWYSME